MREETIKINTKVNTTQGAVIQVNTGVNIKGKVKKEKIESVRKYCCFMVPIKPDSDADSLDYLADVYTVKLLQDKMSRDMYNDQSLFEYTNFHELFYKREDRNKKFEQVSFFTQLAITSSQILDTLKKGNKCSALQDTAIEGAKQHSNHTDNNVLNNITTLLKNSAVAEWPPWLAFSLIDEELSDEKKIINLEKNEMLRIENINYNYLIEHKGARKKFLNQFDSYYEVVGSLPSNTNDQLYFRNKVFNNLGEIQHINEEFKYYQKEYKDILSNISEEYDHQKAEDYYKRFPYLNPEQPSML